MSKERCPIQNPRACLGARCQLFGVCDHNRQLDGRAIRAFVEAQEPLGEECSRVLYDNLWELYAR
jgi:hypothetical protein